MSAFALFASKHLPLPDKYRVRFDAFVDAVAEFKQLASQSVFRAHGISCLAAKFDTASTLHHHITKDTLSGSWLLAVGTVVDTLADRPDGDLQWLLSAYLQHGKKVLERLDGQFLLIIYNQIEDSLAIATDPFGLLTVFYAQTTEGFFASTSALAIAQQLNARPSDFGLRHFILYGNLYGEMTLWQDIKRIAPATVLIFKDNQIKTHKYWDFQPDTAITSLSLNDSVDCVIDALSKAMHHGLAHEDDIWLSLTGGFDSRVLAALATHNNLSFRTYCHGPRDSADVRIARTISQKMAWDYEYFDLPEDWGNQRSQWLLETLKRTDGHLGILKTSRIIREQTIKAQKSGISVWGFGGETYRGYHWKQEFFNVGRTTAVSYDRWLDYRHMPVARDILQDSVKWKNDIRSTLKQQFREIGEQYPDSLNTLKLDLIGQYMESGWGGAHISSVLGLQRVILPFHFKESMTCVLSVNYRWRLFNRLFRVMLERLNPTLANISIADGGPAAPIHLTNIHKFVPYWWDMGEKLAWGLARKILGKSLWRKRDPGTDGATYPLGQWYTNTLRQLKTAKLFVPDQMNSASLYVLDDLRTFLMEPSTNINHLLDRIVTVELLFRLMGINRA